MKKPHTKRSFTIIEVTISAVLFACIVSSVFGYYRWHTLLSQCFLVKKEEVAKERLMQTRLAEVFASIRYSCSRSPEDGFFFTLSNPHDRYGERLIFNFKNTADSDYALSGPVIGTLFLNKSSGKSEGTLTLLMWPAPQNKLKKPTEHMRRIALLDNVESYSLEFWVPKKLHRYTKGKEASASKTLNSAIQLPENEWISSWKQEYLAIPPMIRLTITKDKKPQAFLFFIPKGIQGIEA